MSISSYVNFEELCKQVQKLNQSNSEPWRPEFQFIWLVEEIGELSGELLKLQKLSGRFSERKMKFNIDALKEELGDILYAIVSLSHSFQLDPKECLAWSITKFESRPKNQLE